MRGITSKFIKTYQIIKKVIICSVRNDIIKQCLGELEHYDFKKLEDLKGATELCLSKFRVRRSLPKNATKNKKGNDKNKKENTKEKKKNKREKNDKREEKKTTKGKKNKHVKNKPKVEKNSKKCEVKKSQSTKKVRSKRSKDHSYSEKGGPVLVKHIFTKRTNPNFPEFETVLKEITNCLQTATSGNNRFKFIFYTI